MMTWAEDRAIRGRNLSADPGAETEGRAEDPRVDRPSLPSLRDWHQAINPSRQPPRAMDRR